MGGGHQVEHRQALDLLELGEAEHLEVGLVGPDVHALVDVGDGVARGADQRVAAALGLAQRGLQPAQAAPGLQRGELVAHHPLEVLGAAAQRGARPHGDGAQHRGLVERVHHRDDRQVLAAGVDRLDRRVERDLPAGLGDHHQVDRLLGGQLRQLLERLRPLRAHRDAAVAQHAGQLFRIVDPVFDQQDADHGFLLLRHGHSRFVAGFLHARRKPRQTNGARARARSRLQRGRLATSPGSSRTSFGTR